MRQLISNIWVKAALAAVSGYACYVIFYSHVDGGSAIVGWLLVYGVSGLLFSAGVLFPCLTRDSTVYYRGTELVGVSVLSYWSALQVAMRGTWGPETEDMFAASIVGAAIVLTGAKLIIPLRHSLRFALVGLVAAIFGGLIFSSVSEATFFLAYSLWHLLMAATIFIAQHETLWPRKQTNNV